MSTPLKSADTASAQTRIVELVRSKLAGKPSDPLGLVDAFFGIASAVGELSCRLADAEGLRFSLAGQAQFFDVDLDRARSKLRMLCPRLAVLCNETVPGQDVSLYGGEGLVTRTTMADTESHQVTWRVRFMNTMSEHWFVITAQ